MLNIKGKLISLERPVVMGIVNVTPDSFYAGSRSLGDTAVAARIETILAEGGAMVDIGGYSTRPGAAEVTREEEWRRLEPALKIMKKNYADVPISVDTYRSAIARRAVEEYGVAVVNDVSGGAWDAEMFETVAALKVPYILMHFPNTAETKQLHSVDNGSPAEETANREQKHGRFLEDVMMYFAKKLQTLRRLGVNDVIIDPGFGFGKTQDQNYELMRSLKNFTLLFDCPLMVGVSRKRMIYNLLDCTVEDSLNGTTVLNTWSLLNGVNILRVHDVKAAVEAVKIVEQLKC
jgi:dihydropteroate synthase